jgi:fumarate reductase subunit C
MDIPSYSLPIQEKSKKLVKNSEEKFALAKKAAQIGDDFIFSLVIFSLSLFFGAICTKLDSPAYQTFLWCAGSVILIIGAITIASLPWNIGF